jgi:retron-type reverse transcriptase
LKRYGYLFDKVVSFDNLLLASKKAFKGKKDKSRIAEFYFNLENELIELQKELKLKTYTPIPLITFMIMDPKVRKIGASDIRDRVVHHALCNIIEPFFEKAYIFHSYACRKGKGLHIAVRHAQKYCQMYRYFLKLDIKKYFESVDHEILKNMLKRKFKDPELLWLLNIIIDSSHNWEKGIPIGNLTSQHFANFYLDKMDHYIKDTLRVKGYLRYMDDFLLFENNKGNLHQFKSRISNFLENELLLTLKEEAMVIAPCSSGVSFLGFRIFSSIVRLRQENKRRLLRRMKKRGNEFKSGLIDECKYARSLMSITEHLKIADSYNFRKNVFFKL